LPHTVTEAKGTGKGFGWLSLVQNEVEGFCVPYCILAEPRIVMGAAVHSCKRGSV
jgi:hypothetical protein